MNHFIISLCLTVILVLGLGVPVSAQIKKSGRDITSVNSRYVVTDSAVFEFFLGTQDIPFKIYDFSTRSIYVDFGGNDIPVAVHSFDKLAPGEIEYILDIGCGGTKLSGGFRRFCKR